MFSACYHEVSENVSDNYVCICHNVEYKEYTSDGYSFDKKWFPLTQAKIKAKAYVGEKQSISDEILSSVYLFEDKSLNIFIEKKNIFDIDLYCSDEKGLPQISKNDIEYIIITPDERTSFKSKKCLIINDESDIELLRRDFLSANQFVSNDSPFKKQYDYSNSVINNINHIEELCIFIKFKDFNALNLFAYLKEYQKGKYTLFFYQKIESQEDNASNWKMSERCCELISAW